MIRLPPLLLLLGYLITSCCSSAEDVEGGNYHRRSDDGALGGLETLVQNQAMTISRLQADFAAYKNQMDAKVLALEQRLDAASRPVAFTARISGSRDNGGHGLALTPGQTVIFDDVVANVGNAYHHQDGIFVATVSGTYSFFLQAMGTNENDPLQLDIVRNGAILDAVFVEGSGDAYDQGVSQVISPLSVGDHVWVRSEGGQAIRGSYWSVFTGFLLQAD